MVVHLACFAQMLEEDDSVNQNSNLHISPVFKFVLVLRLAILTIIWE